MRIAKISIDGFGMFDDRLELEFPGDIALIIGDNETGKSTVLSAVAAILFGLKNESERAAFAPHGAASPRSGSLEIEAGGKRHRLSRDFASNHVRVELLGSTGSILFDGSAKPGGRTDEKEAYDELMRKLVGTDSRDVFQNSMMAEQNRLRPEMKNIVRQIVSGSTSADYAVVLDCLKDVCDELSMELPWRRGTARKLRRIEVLQNDIKEKKRALAEACEVGDTIEESRDRLVASEAELADVERGVDSRKKHEEALTSFSQSLKEKECLEEELNEQRNEMREIEKLTAELRGCSEEIDAGYSGYASLPEQAETDIANLTHLEEREQSLEKRYRQAERDSAIDIMQLMRARISVLTIGIVAGLLVAGLGAANLGGLVRIAAILVGIGIAVGPLISIVLALRSQKSAQQGKLGEMTEQLELLKAQVAEIERRYSEIISDGAGAALGKIRKARSLLREREIKKEALRQHPALEEIESKYNQLSNELVIANNKLGKLRSQRPSLGDIERKGGAGKAVETLRAELTGLEARRRELVEEREGIIRKLAAAEAMETVSEETLEDEIAESESELSRLKLSREAHLLAIGTLGEAVSEFRSLHLDRIEKKASDYLGRIASERCLVRLGEDLAPLGVERAGRLLGPERLSQGFSDQLHFVLRLAAVEEISGDVRLPILLDDPFVNFDENRLGAALRMLEKLSESHQVVLFTHDRRYGDWREPARLLER